MKLKNISVKNFRCYASLSLDLHPQLTVLVANNGGGKTTLLDAICKSLWQYLKSFDLAYSIETNRQNRIHFKDMRLLKSGEEMARQLPCEIITNADYGEGLKTWKIYADKEVKRTKNKSDQATKLLNKFSKDQQEKIRNLNEFPIDLPMISFYGTGRLWKASKIKNKTTDEQVSERTRTFAYANCLDSSSGYGRFKSWFTDKSIQELQAQIKLLKSGKQVLTISSEIENPIFVVRKAVDTLLKDTGWGKLHCDHGATQPLALEHKKIGTLSVDVMSDGIKNMVALVADIAYRCSLLNAHLGKNAALKTKGIVMIDEVDMHLHPKWQQTVVSGLTDAFPNIQFILTTHSPQVLSTVPAESIRLLKQGIDKEGKQYATAERPKTQSRGIASSDILAMLMDIDPVPAVDEAKWLSNYKALIQQNQHDTEVAKKLWEKLTAHYGQQHQEILECNRLIRLEKMKSKMNKKQQEG